MLFRNENIVVQKNSFWLQEEMLQVPFHRQQKRVMGKKNWLQKGREQVDYLCNFLCCQSWRLKLKRNYIISTKFFVNFTDIDNCDPNPCQNNGICKDDGASFLCNCSNGFAGNTCSESKYRYKLSPEKFDYIEKFFQSFLHIYRYWRLRFHSVPE